MRIKIFFLLIPLFALIFLPSCSTVSTHDCICTEEFRTIAVLVLDDLNNPAEGLTTTVTNEKGKTFDLKSYSLYPGFYAVMTDEYVRDFTTVPVKILFSAASESSYVNADYFINTDDCKCHINKVSGPDTLYLR